MKFGEKVRAARLAAKYSQKQLAEMTGIALRTIQNYELGTRKPQHMEIVSKLASALDTTVEYLLGNDGMLVISAYERAGSGSARDINALVSEISGLFAGGEIDEDEKDGIMAALNQAYWLAKEKNKKFTPKKFSDKK